MTENKDENSNEKNESVAKGNCPFCVDSDDEMINEEEPGTIGIQIEFEDVQPPKRFIRNRAKYNGKKLVDVLCNDLELAISQPVTTLEVRVKEVVNKLLPNENNYLRKDLRPSKKGIIKLTNLVRHYIVNNLPIPILIAGAACKIPVAEDRGLDLAEVLFIHMLKELNKGVQVWYKRGLDIRIRIEDSTTMVLYDDKPDLAEHMREYINKFEDVVTAMKASSFIRVSTESDLMPLWDYIQVVETAAPIFKRYLKACIERSKAGLAESSEKELNELKKLQEMGWGEGISDKSRTYWIEWYGKQVEKRPNRDALDGVCSYFGTILARKKLKGYGNDESWSKGHIDVAVVPRHDYDRDSTRLFYRSVLRQHSPSSLPYWKLVGARVNKVHMALPPDSELLANASYVSDKFSRKIIRLPSVILQE